MASHLCPDFPAVMVVLQHLNELDRQLREDGLPFAPEASLDLAGIAAAITELEAERRGAHERLEVETIENSKLRHQINTIRVRKNQETMADVAAARASHAEEIDQLHNDINTAVQLLENTMEKEADLLNQIEALEQSREKVNAEHMEIKSVLNHQLTLKYSLQMKLDRTLEAIAELRTRIAAVEEGKVTQQQSMVDEREASAVKKGGLFREVEQLEEEKEQQKQAIRRRRRELDKGKEKKEELQDQLGQLTGQMTNLENKLNELTASRSSCEKQLEGEKGKHGELKQQRETLEKELRELGKTFDAATLRLKEEISSVEDKIQQGQASRSVCQGSLSQVYKIFKRQREEEDIVRAEHDDASQKLGRSRLQLEERIASIVRHSKEIKEMDKQIGELLEMDTIRKHMFERNQEEICGNVDTERKNVSQLEEEKRQLGRLFEEEKEKQEEHVAKMTSDISSTRNRYKELQREEAELHLRQPKSVDSDFLMSHMRQCEAEYREEEIQKLQEIEQLVAEVESMARSNQEKESEVEEREETLKRAEAKWSEEHSRNQGLEVSITELKRKESELELLIKRLKHETNSLLQPKEEKLAELKELRASYVDILETQASELRAVEMSIYDKSVILEQVSMENHRLQVCVEALTEDVSRARQNKDRHQQEVHRFKQDTKALWDSLQEAPREDLLVFEEHQKRDGVVLATLKSKVDDLRTRRQELGNISAALHKQMLHFSRQLGDKSGVEQQSTAKTATSADL